MTRLDILRGTVIIGVVAVLAGCTRPATPPVPSSGPPAVASSPAPLTFVNRVWRVAESNAVAPGQLYVFLSEGTLVIASGTGTPALGSWAREGDGLTMIEDGHPYRVDILSLTGAEFRIRSHNPGQPVDIRLVPAEGDPAAPPTAGR